MTYAWEVVEHLIDIIDGDPRTAGVVVEPGWPGDAIGPETIYVDSIDTESNIPVMTGGRQHYDVVISTPLLFRVTGRVTLRATMARVDELIATVLDVLQDDAGLDGDGGAPSTVIDAVVDTSSMTSARTPEGCIGFGRVIVTVHTRIT